MLIDIIITNITTVSTIFYELRHIYMEIRIDWFTFLYCKINTALVIFLALNNKHFYLFPVYDQTRPHKNFNWLELLISMTNIGLASYLNNKMKCTIHAFFKQNLKKKQEEEKTNSNIILTRSICWCKSPRSGWNCPIV